MSETSPPSFYVWCFSHGHAHHFVPSTVHPDGAWCTASWVRLVGDTPQDAWTDKTNRYGDARFLPDLPLEKQAEVTSLEKDRR